MGSLSSMFSLTRYLEAHEADEIARAWAEAPARLAFLRAGGGSVLLYTGTEHLSRAIMDEHGQPRTSRAELPDLAFDVLAGRDLDLYGGDCTMGD